MRFLIAFGLIGLLFLSGCCGLTGKETTSAEKVELEEELDLCDTLKDEVRADMPVRLPSEEYYHNNHYEIDNVDFLTTMHSGWRGESIFKEMVLRNFDGHSFLFQSCRIGDGDGESSDYLYCLLGTECLPVPVDGKYTGYRRVFASSEYMIISDKKSKESTEDKEIREMELTLVACNSDVRMYATVMSCSDVKKTDEDW